MQIKTNRCLKRHDENEGKLFSTETLRKLFETQNDYTNCMKLNATADISV